MKILVLGINYHPELIGISVYTAGLAEEVQRQCAEVEVVTALPYYPAWKTFNGWRGGWRRRLHNGVRVVHCPLYVPKNPTGIRRILHHASFALTALPVILWKALRQRPDIVFVVAPSMISAPVGRLAAQICGARAWLHIQDFEVEAAFATGLLQEDSRLGRAARHFEKSVLHSFDRVSSISSPMLKKLREKGVPDDQIYELRNWANLSRITPMEEPSPIKAELGIATRYVALYSGNLANKQGLEVIPDIAKRMLHRDDLTFAICGDGPMRRSLESESKDLPNIRFLPLQPIERLNDLLNMADVHLLPQIAGATDLVLPSKLTNMLASGRPVLATADPDTALSQEVEGAGINVRPGDAVAAAAALGELLDDPELRASLGAQARMRAVERWDMASIIDRLRGEFSKLTNVTERASEEEKAGPL